MPSEPSIEWSWWYSRLAAVGLLGVYARWTPPSGPRVTRLPGCGRSSVDSQKSTADRHNAAAASSCASDYKVKILLYENNSSGGRIITCDTLFTNNFRKCSIQNTTASGDYWVWQASIIASDGITYTATCSNQGFPYQDSDLRKSAAGILPELRLMIRDGLRKVLNF